MQAEEIQNRQQTLADAAFERYDFGDNVQIVDHERWRIDLDNGEDDWTKVAYADFADLPDAPSQRISFHVKFEKGTDRLVGAYAYEMDSGNEIGLLPGVR